MKEQNNYNRERIIKENLLEYLHIEKSERNKDIVVLYVNGVSYKELASQIGVTPKRIAQIISQYVNRVVRYKMKQETRY